jgi:hypothetical protein
MHEEKKECLQPAKNPQLLSRREFAIGSVALLGSYASAEAAPIPPLSDEGAAIKLEKSKDVQDLLDARHITDIDLKRVLDHAEKTGKKLYLPNSDRLLSKLRIVDTYFYAEYSPIEEGSFRIHSAYAHRFLIAKEPS